MVIPLRVLIVEDVEDDAFLLARELQQGGFEPTWERVDTTAAMREALAHGPWDVVLADYALPQFSGAVALEVLHESGLDLPVIMVSGTIGEERAAELMRAGAHDVILKGHLARLVPAIARELRDAEERRERKRAEEALREQQELLRIVIDTVPNFIGVKDWEGRFILANRALAEVYGTTPEKIVGKTDADFNPNPEEVEWFRRDDREVMSTRKPKYIPEEKVTDSQGRVRWLATVKIPLIAKDGAASQVLLATHDITERKQAEDALARERAFLASAIELLPSPIIFNSLSGEVIRANQASYQFFGDLDPSSWWQRQLLHPKTGVPMPFDEWPMMRAARGEVVPQTEGTIVLPDGREVPVLVVAAPVYVGEMLVATVVAFSDITPLKEADREKNQFLAVLSHELRTPLTNILGWVKEAQEIPEIIPQALQIIRKNAESQYRMLENLLEVSRLIHRKLELKLEPIDLWQVTSQTVETMRDLAAERRISLILEPPGQPLLVQADMKRMREVISNLLDNAIKFSDSEGQITVTGWRKDERAGVSIHNTGRGISPEQLPTLFTLFQSPQTAEVTGGLHLGLPLVKNIVEAHGGHVSVESQGADQGSTFTIELPLAQGSAD